MGLFGRRKAATEVALERPGPAAIQRLVAFESLTNPQLAKVAQASVIESQRKGRVDMANPEALVFLHQGRLAVDAPGRPRVTLAADQPASLFALPRDPGCQIRLLTPCRLLKVPARYLVLGAAKPQASTVIDWRQPETGDQPVADFYYELKNGECRLPSMPDLAGRIGKVIDDPTTASEHIARVIQSDPALAARVMSVVNSAAHNTGQPIQNLSQAVSRLGRDRIRNLVFSFIVKGIFRTRSAALKKRMTALWAHSCHVGAIAAILARETPGLDSERALLAGLVHDIGVVPILDQARKHDFLLENPGELDRVISQLRAEIGTQTMRQWGFDQSFIDVAARAEDWRHAGEALPDYLDVVILAQLHAYVGTPRMAELPRIDQVPAFRKLAGGALTPEGSMAVIEAAGREIDELRRLLASG